MTDELPRPGKDVNDALCKLFVEFMRAADEGDRRVHDVSYWSQKLPHHAAEVEEFVRSHNALLQDAQPVEATALAAAIREEITIGVPQSLERAAALETVEGACGATERFGSYELLEEIARGGMGVVYKARQVGLNRVVALKLILSGQLADREEVTRFHREAEAAGKLEHPGIVPIYEVGEYNQRHYYSMGFVEGRSLREHLEQSGPLEPREAANLLVKIADAVAHAHQRGVVHRDLKPANILMDRTGEPRIADFGLAKRLDEPRELTTTGQILGSAHYMAPEQAQGIPDITESADIYALGAILFCLLTGNPPFQAEQQLDLLLRVIESEPAWPHRVNPDVPRDLSMICIRCLEKNPRRRYASATELSADLQRFLQNEPVDAKTSLGRLARRWLRREPALVTHLAALGTLELCRHIEWLVGGPGNATWTHHWLLSAIFAAWAVGCFALRGAYRYSQHIERMQFVWAVMDVGFTTLILLLARPPLGALMNVYALLIAGAALFFRMRLIVSTTVLAVASLLLVVVLRPYPASPPPLYVAIHAVTLIAIAVMVGIQVRRFQHTFSTS